MAEVSEATTDSGRSCFVISPIGDEGSTTRNRANKVLRYVIEPVLADLHYEAIRADRIAEPGMITNQIIQHIVDDSLVIADLTDANPNVYYELAIRHTLRKPVVLLIQAGQMPRFDVQPMRFISLDHTDLDSVHDCMVQMTDQIRSLERDPENVESPVSIAVDVQRRLTSANPDERTFGEVLVLLQDLSSRVDRFTTQSRYEVRPSPEAIDRILRLATSLHARIEKVRFEIREVGGDDRLELVQEVAATILQELREMASQLQVVISGPRVAQAVGPRGRVRTDQEDAEGLTIDSSNLTLGLGYRPVHK